MWNWGIRDQLKRAASRYKTEDIRTGSVPRPPSKEERLVKFAALHVCHLKDQTVCNFRKRRHGEYRCGAVQFAKTDCPYLGAPQPLQMEVEKEKKVETQNRLVVEAPPKIDC